MPSKATRRHWKKWQPGEPITINRVVWDDNELYNIQDVFERDWFGPSYYASELERALARFVGTKYAQLLNSGSSALLLAAQTLRHRLAWAKNEFILHPACTFPTSCNCIWQSGAVPVFVDVEEGTYVVSAEHLERALEQYPQIRGMVLPHLLGNVPDMDRILAALDYRPLIEDCCDTLGSKYGGKQVGTFGVAAAFSFYASHHLTTAGVGGALLTDDEETHETVHSMAFWGRAFNENGDAYHDFANRYTYKHVGYNMQMTEIQAAFGLAQMARLEEMNRRRANQFEITDEFMQRWSEWLVLPREHDKAEPSWFGYPVLVKETAPFDREALVRHLLNARVEIRPLFAGNLTRQPGYNHLPYIVIGSLPQANRNMERAFFLPSWGGMTDEMTAYLFDIIARFMQTWT